MFSKNTMEIEMKQNDIFVIKSKNKIRKNLNRNQIDRVFLFKTKLLSMIILSWYLFIADSELEISLEIS